MNCLIHFRSIKPSSVNDAFRHNQALNKYYSIFAKPYASCQQVSGGSQLQNRAYHSWKGLRTMYKIRRFYGTASPLVPAYKTKKHSDTWIWERIVAIGLIGLLPFAVFDTTHAIEASACLFTAAHLNWGLEAICVDYLRPSVVGNLVPKLIPVIVNVPLLLTFYGVVHLILTQEGVVHVIKQFWFLKTSEELKNIEQLKNSTL